VKTLEDFTREQSGAVRFIKAHPQGAVIWGDVGTGKTPITHTALLDLRRSFDVSRTLVVGPRLVAERVWSTEVTEWAHLQGVTVSRIVGTPKQRLAAMARPADIHTISRDNVTWLEQQFIAATQNPKTGKVTRKQYRVWPWDTLILDESQSFKHQGTARFKSIRRLRCLCRRIILLTGSLMPNGRGDLWAQYYLVDGGERLGLTEEAYQSRWWDKNVTDGVVDYVLKTGAAEEIDRRIADITYTLIDTREKVAPNIIRLQLSESEQKLYDQMVRKSCIEVGGQTITAISAGVLWGKLLQMANGAIYDSNGAYHVVHNRKLEALVELLESLPRPVIVGYGFVHDVERIQSYLQAKGHSRVDVIRSGASLDRWRAGATDIGIMHPASAGHGLNDLYVSGCRHIVWFGYSPNREFYDQLNGRILGGHRRQDGVAYGLHHLHCDRTIDVRALALLDFKGEDQSTAQRRIAEEMIHDYQRAAVPPDRPSTGAR
jgi:SNF2 family DNA or RNA helicase